MASNGNDEKDESPIPSSSNPISSVDHDEKEFDNPPRRHSHGQSNVKKTQSVPNVSATVTFPPRKNSKKKQTINTNTKTNKDKINSNSNSNSPSASISGSLVTNSGSDNDGEPEQKIGLIRAKTMPARLDDPCREFDNFEGDWVDSKGQPVIISAWGVIRYPNNPKLRFEAVHMGPNHLSVTFDRDPKKRKFVGKLNHDCNVLIWSNDTKWTRKGTKLPAEYEDNDVNGNTNGTPNGDNTKNNNNNSNNSNNEAPSAISRQGSCLVM